MADHVEPKLSPADLMRRAEYGLEYERGLASIDVELECACGESIELYSGDVDDWDTDEALWKITGEGWTFRQDPLHGPSNAWVVTWQCPSCSSPDWTWPEGHDPNEEEGGEE